VPVWEVPVRRQPKYAKRRDIAEAGIESALRKAGCKVWKHLPADLLVRVPSDKPGVFRVLECKTAKGGKLRLRKDQAEQAAFCEETGVPYVTNDVEALKAVGVLGLGEEQ
jgi:Holliday junction resolvase